MLGKVSIIVPVYNVEKYLKKCLESLRNQTYRNLEVLLIDDGSTDASGDICDQYASLYVSFFKVFHKKNGGLPDARNYGLDKITGDYVMFIDSDDWIDEDYIEICVQEFTDLSIDAVITPYIREFKNKTCRTYVLGRKRKVFYESDVKKKLHRRFFGLLNDELKKPISLDELNSAWGKLYRREKIIDVRFTDVKIIGSAEDAWFNVQAFDRLGKVVYVPTKFYHYNKLNDGSIVHSYRRDLLYTKEQFHKLLLQYIVQHGLEHEYCEALSNRKGLAILDYARNVLNSDLTNQEKKSEFKKILLKDDVQYDLKGIKLHKLPIKWGIYYYMCKYKWSNGVLCMTWIAEHLKKYMR